MLYVRLLLYGGSRGVLKLGANRWREPIVYSYRYRRMDVNIALLYSMPIVTGVWFTVQAFSCVIANVGIESRGALNHAGLHRYTDISHMTKSGHNSYFFSGVCNSDKIKCTFCCHDNRILGAIQKANLRPARK